MNLETLSQALKCEVIHRGDRFDQIRVAHVAAGDLMSEVLVRDEEDLLLVTSLASEQVIRTADIVEATAVLLVNGKDPQPSMAKLAKDLDLPILRTTKPLFETCHDLGKLLESNR